MSSEPVDQTDPEPRPLSCGWCYVENGEEVHPHPECKEGASNG